MLNMPWLKTSHSEKKQTRKSGISNERVKSPSMYNKNKKRKSMNLSAENWKN